MRALVASLFGAALASPDSGSLVQSTVRVHDETQAPGGTFLVDNSRLKHNGPGLLLRKTPRMSDTFNSSFYLNWGSTFTGKPAGKGWVQYKEFFLPTMVQNIQVLTLKNIVVNGASLNMQRKIHYHYSPTEMKLPSGDWVPCKILHEGRQFQTFDVEVRPKHFATYTMSGVPIANLAKVHRVRDFDPVTSTPAPVAEVAEPMVHLVVKDGPEGEDMHLKMFAKSPLRTLMKMACDRAGISTFRCLKKVKFTWKGDFVHADNTTQSLNMADGEVLEMIRDH